MKSHPLPPNPWPTTYNAQRQSATTKPNPTDQHHRAIGVSPITLLHHYQNKPPETKQNKKNPTQQSPPASKSTHPWIDLAIGPKPPPPERPSLLSYLTRGNCSYM